MVPLMAGQMPVVVVVSPLPPWTAVRLYHALRERPKPTARAFCRLQQDPETHAFRVAICLCWPFHSSCGSVPFSSGVVVSWSCMAVPPPSS